MRTLCSLFLSLLISFNLLASSIELIGGSKNFEHKGFLVGRISRINEKANLIRIRIESQNSKYISKGDFLEIWGDSDSGKKRCKTELLGKTVRHFLLKAPHLAVCLDKLQLSVERL